MKGCKNMSFDYDEYADKIYKMSMEVLEDTENKKSIEETKNKALYARQEALVQYHIDALRQISADISAVSALAAAAYEKADRTANSKMRYSVYTAIIASLISSITTAALTYLFLR